MKNKEKHIRHRDVQDALELMGGRWRGAIMASLCAGPKRFVQLKTDLSPITARMLIKELRFLEINQIIKSEKNASTTNAAYYSLSEHGKSIEPIIISIHGWAKIHRKLMLSKLTV